MQAIDYLKALGVGVGVLALNLLATTLIITAYAMLVAPGQPQEHYTAMAPQIGAWSGPLGGMVLMFLAGWWFARRRPERAALRFIAVVWISYLLVDAALGVAAGGAAAILTVNFALSLGGGLLAGLAGAMSGPRRAS